MNSSQSLCDTANYLAHDTQLIVMLCFRVVVAIIGLFFFAVLFKIQGTYMAFHDNARLLFISHHIWAVMQATTNLLGYASTLIRFAQPFTNPCQYLVSTTFSIVFAKGPSVFTVYGQVWALASMAIERCFATYRYRDYETRSSFMGKMLLTAQWVMTALWVYIVLAGLDFSAMKAYPSTSSGNTSTTLSNLLFILAGVEISSISIFGGLLWYNQRKSKMLGAASLTEKYQIGENIRATQLMLPMVITHFCVFMPSLISLPFYMKFIDPTLDARRYTVYVETVNTNTLYCVLLPLVLLWRHKVLRQNLRKALGINEISPDAPRDQQHMRHFELLKNMWRGPPT